MRQIAPRVLALPLLAISAATLTACDSGDIVEEAPGEAMASEEDDGPHGPTATAALLTIAGDEVGAVTITGTEEGLVIDVTASNMVEGSHPMHIHEVGSCEDGFAAAGDHWMPEHNMPAPADGGDHAEAAAYAHAGELPNLEVAADGTGTLTATLPMAATFIGLMDQDGSSIMVHTTDGSSAGGSGDRYACGVFAAS